MTNPFQWNNGQPSVLASNQREERGSATRRKKLLKTIDEPIQKRQPMLPKVEPRK